MAETARMGARRPEAGGDERVTAAGMNDLLTIRDLRVDFRVHGGIVRAVRGISFSVPRGGSVALVGESGSGKTVVSQAVMGILPEIADIKGEILFSDPMKGGAVTDIAKLGRDSRAMRAIRGGRISIIFQEPMTSLSPLHTIGNQIVEALRLHRDVPQKEAEALVEEMLRLVGFPDPRRGLNTYPFELSGGLRQRAMIAMALVCNPALLIADEPTTALDVTMQAQILDLLQRLKKEVNVGLVLITHDLGVVARMAHRVSVMYAGEVVESVPAAELFGNPTHPYTRGLLACVPVPGKVRRDQPLGSIPGVVPRIGHGFAGCAFRDRCGQARPECARTVPWQTGGEHGWRCVLPSDWSGPASLAA